MNLVLIAMIITLLIPIYDALQNEDIWQKMLAFASVSTKAAIIILFVSVLRDDWMIGIVAVIILTVGNAGLMLLAHILKKNERSMINLLSYSCIAVGIVFWFWGTSHLLSDRSVLFKLHSLSVADRELKLRRKYECSSGETFYAG